VYRSVGLLHPLHVQYAGTQAFKNAQEKYGRCEEDDKDELEKGEERNCHPSDAAPDGCIYSRLIQPFHGIEKKGEHGVHEQPYPEDP